MIRALQKSATSVIQAVTWLLVSVVALSFGPVPATASMASQIRIAPWPTSDPFVFRFDPMPGTQGTLRATGMPAAVYLMDNLAGAITWVTNPDDICAPIFYDADGWVFTMPGGRQLTFDAQGNLTTITDRAGQSLTFTHNGIIHSSGATGQRRAAQDGTGRTSLYGYDTLWRLTAETIGSDPHGKNGSASYTYDAVGNRLSRSSTVAGLVNQAFGYDADDRVQGDTYDANGNTKAGSASQPAGAYAGLPSAPPPGQGESASAAPVAGTDTYDSQNRLVARSSGSASSVQIVYDGDGNKVQETVTRSGLTFVTTYLVDDRNPTGYAQVIEEQTNGTLSRVYTWGMELISQDQVLGSGASSQWTLSYYGYDGHGNARFLTDVLGNVTDAYDYDAFGNLVNVAVSGTSPAGGAPNEHLYCGEQLDSGLGMYYLRSRLMNPVTGRFWAQDAYSGVNRDPQSLHKYVFARCAPSTYIDPSGMMGIIPEAFVRLVPRWVSNLASSIGPEVALYIFLGYLAHIQIQTAYIEDFQNFGHEVYANRWLSTILPLGPSVSTGFNSRLRPDIADATTSEVYEIKSALNNDIDAAIQTALPQLLKYLSQLNDAISAGQEQGSFSGKPYTPGVLWTPPPEVQLLDLFNISVERVAPGVVVYGSTGEIEKIVTLFGLIRRGPAIVAAEEEAELETSVGVAEILTVMGGVF